MFNAQPNHECRPSRKIYISFVNRVAQATSCVRSRVLPARGTESNTDIYFGSLALLPNRVSRFVRFSVVKFLNPCATKNNIYFLCSLSVLPKRNTSILSLLLVSNSQPNHVKHVSVLPKGNLFFVNTRCPRGELKAIQIFIYLFIYYLATQNKLQI